MKRRIGLWALCGSVVASVWVLYAVATWPNLGRAYEVLVEITAPASLLGGVVPLTYYWFILLNGIFYALLGITAELIRRRSGSALSGASF